MERITTDQLQAEVSEHEFLSSISDIEARRLAGKEPSEISHEIWRLSIAGGELYQKWLAHEGVNADEREVFVSVFMPFIYFRLLTTNERKPTRLEKLSIKEKNSFLISVAGMFRSSPKDPHYLLFTGKLVDKALEYMKYLNRKYHQ